MFEKFLLSHIRNSPQYYIDSMNKRKIVNNIIYDYRINQGKYKVMFVKHISWNIGKITISSILLINTFNDLLNL